MSELFLCVEGTKHPSVNKGDKDLYIQGAYILTGGRQIINIIPNKAKLK